MVRVALAVAQQPVRVRARKAFEAVQHYVKKAVAPASVSASAFVLGKDFVVVCEDYFYVFSANPSDFSCFNVALRNMFRFGGFWYVT